METSKKWYQKTPGIIVLLVLFFPVGLFVMWKYASWHKFAKIGVTGLFALIVLGGTASDSNKKQAVTPPTPTEVIQTEKKPTPITATTIESQKEIKILQEQKTKAENLTKTAVDLITEDKMSEAIALYNARWNELAKLRVEILYDKDLTDAQKKNIDNALKADQEGVTSVLSKYEQLYR